MKYLLPVLMAATAVSCEDWLNVTSSSELQADKLYETRTGFYEALTGVYMTMGGASTYGGSYMWSVNNYVAYPYNINSQIVIGEIQKHLYSHTKIRSVIDQMWYNGYFTIANINIILRELEARRSVISSDVEYDLFKGELLALRAMIHFDIMRMFGVNDWSGENAAKLTIPYVKEYSAEVTPQLSYEETERLLMDDINNAIECLRRSDPIVADPGDSFDSTINAEGYWTNRGKHMNYYAAIALAARIYQWKKEYETAAKYAQEVIDGAFDAGLVSWVDAYSIVNETSDDQKDWIFSTEHLFSLDVTDLYSSLRLTFFTSDENSIYIDDSFVNLLFPPVDSQTGSVAGLEDIRGTALHLKYTGLGYVLYKYYGSTSYNVKFRNRIPMSRISEMYYIVAEYLIDEGDISGAMYQLDEVRARRGITSRLQDFVAALDPSEELMKEYYREFVGEDKLFYYLKHVKAEKSLSETFDLSASALIYPYPDEEINYGRKQELN